MQEDRIQPTTPRSFSETDGIELKYTSSALTLKSNFALPDNVHSWIRNGFALVMGFLILLWIGFWAIEFSRKEGSLGEMKERAISNNYYYTSVSDKLIDFYRKERAVSILDLECGNCFYGKSIKDVGFEVQAFDGNPYSEELTNGFVKFKDFSQVQDLRTKYDWVQSLEIQSHISEEQLKTFLGNMARHAYKGIILSWSAYRHKSQAPEDGIRINQNIINMMRPHKFQYDDKTTMEFRNLPNADEVRDGILVFRIAEI